MAAWQSLAALWSSKQPASMGWRPNSVEEAMRVRWDNLTRRQKAMAAAGTVLVAAGVAGLATSQPANAPTGPGGAWTVPIPPTQSQAPHAELLPYIRPDTNSRVSTP